MINKILKLFRKKEAFISLNTSRFNNSNELIVVGGDSSIYNKKDERQKISPIEIIHELEHTLTPISTESIDILLKEMKLKKDFAEDMEFDTKDIDRAIDMLKARKKYPKYAHLFHWKTTTPEKVRLLLEKYKLSCRSLRDYISAVPEKAMNEMQEYVNIHKKITKNKIQFEIIAPPEYFKEQQRKGKDPILLVMSPFGDYYYILCAWDKEVSIVDQLLTNEELITEEVKK